MFFALLILYFIFVGAFSVTNLVLGVIVAALLTVFCRKFVTGPAEKVNPRKIRKKFCYFLFLIGEIFKSNIAVAKKIWSKDPLTPKLVRFRSGLKTQSGNVLVANSITLTPGTYTCELEDGSFAVHGLDNDFVVGIEANSFITKVGEMEALNG